MRVMPFSIWNRCRRFRAAAAAAANRDGTGAFTSTEPLNYTILEDNSAEPEKAFRLTVSQSGRVVQFKVLNVVIVEQS